MTDDPSEPLANVADDEEAAALVSSFFRIAAILQLSETDMAGLLGLPDHRRLDEIRKATPDGLQALTDEELTRLAFVILIYHDLEILFSKASIISWLKNSAVPQNGYNRPWGSEAPLAHMMHAEDGFRDVYSYVKGMLNGL